MKRRKIKNGVIYSLYGMLVIGLTITLYSLTTNSQKLLVDDSLNYVSKTILENTVSVVATDVKIQRPYVNQNISVLKNYYEYDSEESTQQGSIIYYQNTYMQSSGIAYGGVENFEVLSILPGTVTSVFKDELLGTVVEITHSNNIVSLYQSISDVRVQENDIVNQGDVVGLSGTSNIQSDLGSHLYFEMIIDGTIVNPESYYGKSLTEL